MATSRVSDVAGATSVAVIACLNPMLSCTSWNIGPAHRATDRKRCSQSHSQKLLLTNACPTSRTLDFRPPTWTVIAIYGDLCVRTHSMQPPLRFHFLNSSLAARQCPASSMLEKEPTSPISPLAPYPPLPPTESRSRAPEFYGFVAWTSTYLLFCAYLLWALLPDKYIVWLGVTWYPNRWESMPNIPQCGRPLISAPFLGNGRSSSRRTLSY